MAYQTQTPVNQHTIIKPQKWVEGLVGEVQDRLSLPLLFTRMADDTFRGTEGDTVNYKIPGLFAAREYTFRNDRSNPIVFDEYTERKLSLTVSGRIYHATRMTDEQIDFDKMDYASVLREQGKAVASLLNKKCADAVKNQAYQVTIGNVQDAPLSALFEARKVLNKFRAPNEDRVLLVGSDFAHALMENDAFVKAQNSGDAFASSVLQSANLGKVAGMQVVENYDIDPNVAYAFSRSGFALFTGMAHLPRGVYGATTTADNFALRWVVDYELERYMARSAVDTYCGTLAITDHVYSDRSGTPTISTNPYFLRAIKLDLDNKTDYPAAASELATLTGVSDADVWVPGKKRGVNTPETDAANV